MLGLQTTCSLRHSGNKPQAVPLGKVVDDLMIMEPREIVVVMVSPAFANHHFSLSASASQRRTRAIRGGFLIPVSAALKGEGEIQIGFQLGDLQRRFVIVGVGKHTAALGRILLTHTVARLHWRR